VQRGVPADGLVVRVRAAADERHDQVHVPCRRGAHQWRVPVHRRPMRRACQILLATSFAVFQGTSNGVQQCANLRP